MGRNYCVLLLREGNGKEVTDLGIVGKEMGGKSGLFFTPFIGKRNSPSSLPKTVGKCGFKQ